MKDAANKKILKLLNDSGHEAKLEEETSQISLSIKIDNLNHPTFFRVIEEGPMLQVICFLPVQYTKTTAGDTARLLHLFNKEIDQPGFGMDESSGTAFYRRVMPLLPDQLEAGEFDEIFKLLEVICGNFAKAIHAVGSGAITYDAIIEKAQAQNKE